MNCMCGERAVSNDGLCKVCLFIRERFEREARWKRRYDGRSKPKPVRKVA